MVDNKLLALHWGLVNLVTAALPSSKRFAHARELLLSLWWDFQAQSQHNDATRVTLVFCMCLSCVLAERPFVDTVALTVNSGRHLMRGRGHGHGRGRGGR